MSARHALQLAVPYLAVGLGLWGLRSGWAAFLIYHALAVGTVLAVRGPAGTRALLAQVHRGWHPGFALAAVAFGASGGLLLYLLWPWVHMELDPVHRLRDLGLFGTSWIVFLGYHVGVNPWLEEVFWREHLGSRSLRLTAADLAFAGYHLLVLGHFMTLPWLAPSLVSLIAAAWSWRWLRSRTDGLLVPCLSHLAADAGVMLAVHLRLAPL